MENLVGLRFRSFASFKMKSTREICLCRSIISGIFLRKSWKKNDGKLTQYYVENDHEAIIEREIWDAAQLEINRIKEFKRNHQIRELGSSSLEPFMEKFFVGAVVEGW